MSVSLATILAYGERSSGKTFTMTGITECAVADIYNYIAKVLFLMLMFDIERLMFGLLI